MRTELRVAEDRHEAFLAPGADCVFEPARFFIHFVPWHPQDVREEAFRETMAAHDADRDAQAALGQLGLAASDVSELPLGRELLQHPGNGSRSNPEIGG